MAEREPCLYAVAIATQLAARADRTGTVRVNLEALDALMRSWQGSSARKVSAADVVLALAEAGWLQVVKPEGLTFKLAVPDDLGPVPEPTDYTYAKAVQWTHKDGKKRAGRVKAR